MPEAPVRKRAVHKRRVVLAGYACVVFVDTIDEVAGLALAKLVVHAAVFEPAKYQGLG